MGVNGHASYCTENCKDLFDGDLKLVNGNHQVDRIGSGIAIKGIGTFKFKLEDNDGQVHTIQIPHSLYVPSLKRVLLAPHHWVQEAQDNIPTPRGTWMSTYYNCIILYWNQGKSKRKIFLSTNTNTPSTRMAWGTKSYQAYSAEIEVLKACTPHSRCKDLIQHPNHSGPTNDSNEFIAKENLLWDPHCNKGVLEKPQLTT